MAYHCLHLRLNLRLRLCLQWDLVIHIGRVCVCCQWQARGVWLVPLIEGLEVPPDFLHIRLGGVGRLRGRVPILLLQYGVHSVGIFPYHGRLQTPPDLSC